MLQAKIIYMVDLVIKFDLAFPIFWYYINLAPLIPKN